MNAPAALSLCIYCGSRDGAEPAYANAAAQAGELVGRAGWQLVYGGGRAGLMGRVADAAIAHGAWTVGVIPQSLMQRELGHPGLDELHVVETMHERKRMMAERADAFLALPGGIGTFEELFEVWTWRQLGYHDKPVALLNVDGYYDKLIEFLDQTQQRGFVNAAQRELLLVDSDAKRLFARIAEAARAATSPDDYQRI
jgi:uncharacterized protein (TIGR00730 family)